MMYDRCYVRIDVVCMLMKISAQCHNVKTHIVNPEIIVIKQLIL